MKNLLPTQAKQFLDEQPDALFIDCRTDHEFFLVGHPVGAVLVPWVQGDDWELNQNFVDEVRHLTQGEYHRPVVLICRSGNRSVDAGRALEHAGFTQVLNVVHGFEGDRDDHHQRGKLNGWRFDGLPWEQM
jgi:rhodanese-related sulfurtransferase